MHQPAITGTGVHTPPDVITNDELVAAFNAYVDRFNAENAGAIAATGTPTTPLSPSAPAQGVAAVLCRGLEGRRPGRGVRVGILEGR